MSIVRGANRDSSVIFATDGKSLTIIFPTSSNSSVKMRVSARERKFVVLDMMTRNPKVFLGKNSFFPLRGTKS